MHQLVLPAGAVAVVRHLLAEGQLLGLPDLLDLLKLKFEVLEQLRLVGTRDLQRLRAAHEGPQVREHVRLRRQQRQRSTRARLHERIDGLDQRLELDLALLLQPVELP